MQRCKMAVGLTWPMSTDGFTLLPISTTMSVLNVCKKHKHEKKTKKGFLYFLAIFLLFAASGIQSRDRSDRPCILRWGKPAPPRSSSLRRCSKHKAGPPSCPSRRKGQDLWGQTGRYSHLLLLHPLWVWGEISIILVKSSRWQTDLLHKCFIGLRSKKSYVI